MGSPIAGPRFDHLVREIVFGVVGPHAAPPYSTDPGRAYEVARKMEERGFEWGMHYEGSRKDRTINHLYVVCFGGGGDPKEEKKREGISDEFPHAICLAAVNALQRTS